jgi:Na+/H+ antiporter NhaD/arsenite permease-like protein
MMNLPEQYKKSSDDSDADPQIVMNNTVHTTITNPTLAKISVIILLIVISGFIIVEALRFLGIITDRGFSISIITIMGATILYAISKERTELIKSIDYSILIFFAAMFVFTAGLWSSGLMLEILSYIPNPVPNSSLAGNNAIIASISISISHLLGNVPFVALYNLVMIDNGFAGDDVYEWMMLAAASTIAGNLTILGAASIIIIIGAAESRGFKSFGYVEFLKIGSIVTLVTVIIYYLFILFVSYI